MLFHDILMVAATQGGGLAAFTPLSLSPTAWYDPSDITTLFQDSAGTTPVTASGDPVGRMNDKSGNGNNMLQATAAARPIYTVAGAVKYLQNDGVDDYFSRTFSPNFTGGIVTAVFAGRWDTGAGANNWCMDMMLGNGNSYDNANGATLLIIQSGVDKASHNNVNSTGIALAADTDAVMRNSINATNFVQQLDTAAAVTNAHGLTPAFNCDTFTLGANVAGSSPLKGRDHGALLFNRTLTAGEISNLTTWLAAKQGRVL